MASCEKCYKYYNSVVSKECDFCRDCSFNENILCDLLQAEHKSYEVECSAFRPNLSVIDKANKKQEIAEFDNNEATLTDHHKWLKAYAIQQWNYDDSQIFCHLNYHLCLLTDNRNTLIQKLIGDIEKVSVILAKAGDQFKGKVSLLCIGVDHVHLHINSPPDYSADEVVKKMISFLEVEMNSVFQDLFESKQIIFHKTYFIESIG